MKKIAIVGGGGLGREILEILLEINEFNQEFDIIGFFDDELEVNSKINGHLVKGKLDDLIDINYELNVVLGVGNPIIKQNIITKLSQNKNLCYPVIIHPSVRIATSVALAKGSVICSGNILTCNINIGQFVLLNLSCTVGHDSVIGDFCSFMPSVNISGDVRIENNVYVGTGATIINQMNIGKNSIIGAGAVVTKNIPSNCTAVGMPAKPIKYHNNEK